MSLKLISTINLIVALLLNLSGEIAANECGTVEFIDPRISSGTQTVRGAWPFLAALYYIEESKFFCGATVITPKNVLTGIPIFITNCFSL